MGSVPEAIGKSIANPDGHHRRFAARGEFCRFFTSAFEEGDQRCGDEVFPEKDFAGFSIPGFAVRFHDNQFFGYRRSSPATELIEAEIRPRKWKGGWKISAYFSS
jgi:hypothetical protein